LNLTWETRDGIVNSSKVREDIFAEGYGTPASLEGQIVKVSDAVAYINHDIADALRADVIAEEELPKEVSEVLGRRHSERINTLVCDIIENSWAAIGDKDVPVSEIRIGMSDKIAAAANTLREFMFQRVYLWEGRREEAEHARRVISVLYDHFMQYPDEMQTEFGVASDPLWRRVADFVSGMTDQFALATAERLGARLH